MVFVVAIGGATSMAYQKLGSNREDKADEYLDLFSGASVDFENNSREGGDYMGLFQGSLGTTDIDGLETDEYMDICDGSSINSLESLDSPLIIVPRKKHEKFNKKKGINRVLNREQVKKKLKKELAMQAEKSKVTDLSEKEKLENKKIDSQKEKVTLQYMANEILNHVKIILHGGSLYYYTGKTYQLIEDDEELLRLIRSAVSYTAFDTNSTRKFTDLIKYLKADERLIPENYDERIRKAQYYVALQNGVLDLQTMELHPHSDKYLTFYQLDVEWGHKEKPKHFVKFLKSISNGDEEIMLRIVEAMGYMLSPINAGKYFFVMGTAPNSGKTTLGELLRWLIGSNLVCSIAPYQMSGRFALGNIHGKMLNLSMDLPNGELTAYVVSIIKQITGGDMIATEQKYEKMKELKSNMRFLFASNYPVTVPQEDDDDGFWNRMIILPFLYSISKEEEDNQLIEKLVKEKSAIAYLCLSAVGRVLKNHCIFSECKAADEMKDNWRYRSYDYSGTIQSFVDEKFEVTGNDCDGIYSQEVYDEYKRYCSEKGWNKVSYSPFCDWLTSNLDGCEKKRYHETGKNPRSRLFGIHWKSNIDE